MKVLIAGGGIIGASLAYHLGEAGAEVVVVDSNPQRGGKATPASFSWINASHGNPRHYFDLRMQSIGAWRELGARLPELGVRMSGGLFNELKGAELESYVSEYASWGYDIRLIEAPAVRAIEPLLRNPPALAALVRDEGMIEPVEATQVFVKASGAAIIKADIQAIALDGGRAKGLQTSAGLIEAECVIVSAGTASPAILASAGVDLPLDDPKGLLVSTQPIRNSVNHLLITEKLHARQRADGSLLIGSDFLGTYDMDNPQQTADRLVASLQEMLSIDEQLEVRDMSIGARPTPRDGFPVFGAVSGIDGLFVAVTHSGVTLAPVAGMALASEVLHGNILPLAKQYRLERFAR
ncbi:MAG: FAD-binding oxidoreductase [Rhizobiaceae bacterium]